MSMDRRKFMAAASAALAASPWLARDAAANSQSASAAHDMMSSVPPDWMGKEQIGMLLYPGMTALDFVGPQHMFASLMGATVHHIAATTKPVKCESGLSLVPTKTFASAPRQLDIIFVPGGGDGTIAAMRNAALLEFLADRGARARWVTSVCTGSLVLGAAGLLRGYQATSHWALRDVLPAAGATPVDARVVHDRNRVTGAGVSAGLDLGLTMVGMLRDERYAQTVQLLAEYAPEPPYNAGSPKTAPPDVTAMTLEMFKEYRPRARQLLAAAVPKGIGGQS